MITAGRQWDVAAAWGPTPAPFGPTSATLESQSIPNSIFCIESNPGHQSLGSFTAPQTKSRTGIALQLPYKGQVMTKLAPRC